MLLLALAALSPAGPAFTTLLAQFDRSHHIGVAADANGVRVVLRHDLHCLAAHHHGMIARTLTLFAQPTSHAQTDHVLQFQSTSAVSAPKQLTASINAGPLTALNATLTQPDFAPRYISSPRAAPADPAGFVGLRSTVLLI